MIRVIRLRCFWSSSISPSAAGLQADFVSELPPVQGPRDLRRQDTPSDWESDLHLSDDEVNNEDSDSDWQEKYAARKNNNSVTAAGRAAHRSMLDRKSKGTTGGTLGKAKSKSEESHNQDSSIKDSHIMALPSFRRGLVPITGVTEPPPHTQHPSSLTPRQCCSCNQSSGCKTKKCECKAGGGHCGALCSCKAERCANREELAAPESEVTDASSSSPGEEFQGSIPASFEIAQSETSPVRDGTERRLSLVGILDEVEAGARRAERAMAAERAAMAAEAAALLDNAWKEGTSPVRESGHHCAGNLGSGEESEIEERVRRRPLSDLGNIKGTPNQGKPKRKQRATFQIITQELPTPLPAAVEPPTSPLPPSITSLISARASSASATSHFTVPHTVFSDAPIPMPLPLPPGHEPMTANSPMRMPPSQEPMQGIAASSPMRMVSSYEPLISANSPLRMLPSYQRRMISPSASPLKTNGPALPDSRHTTLGGMDSRQNALGGLGSIKSRNGEFGSVDLMRSNNGPSSSSSHTPTGRRKEAIPMSTPTKHEKENIRSASKDPRR